MRLQTWLPLAPRLARLAVRAVRRRLRTTRPALPVHALDAGPGVRLVPVTTDAAARWFELTGHGRPPAEGLAASTLGGAARTPRQWRTRVRQVQRHVRRGDQRGYLVETDHGVVGEALAFLDGGTALAELVVWLADVPGARDAFRPVIATMTDELLGPHARRTMFTAPVGDTAAAEVAADLGFAREGTFADPPFADRDVYVRHAATAGAAA